MSKANAFMGSSINMASSKMKKSKVPNSTATKPFKFRITRKARFAISILVLILGYLFIFFSGVLTAPRVNQTYWGWELTGWLGGTYTPGISDSHFLIAILTIIPIIIAISATNLDEAQTSNSFQVATMVWISLIALALFIVTLGPLWGLVGFGILFLLFAIPIYIAGKNGKIIWARKK